MSIKFQIFMLLLIAPFIGLIIGFQQVTVYSSDTVESLHTSYEDIQISFNDLKQEVLSMQLNAYDSNNFALHTNAVLKGIRTNAHAEMMEYERQRTQLDSLVEASVTQTRMSEGVLDQILARILGNPIGQTFGKNATIKVYSLEEAGYRGVMAKVKIHNPNAIKMVLAEDQIQSSGETTSQAATRHDAILAVNAGGFMSQSGKIRPLGITIIDGEVVTFSNSDLSVIGFNRQGNLVGGRITSQEQIHEMGIIHGASFLPTLLKDGKKQPIPREWANARHPRTLIGHFQNGDLLFIVIDGRRDGWSNGVTLEEAQDKLLEFNVRDAYNLDGGGSSTFYYDGEVLNKPSSGSERRVTTNIVILP